MSLFFGIEHEHSRNAAECLCVCVSGRVSVSVGVCVWWVNTAALRLRCLACGIIIAAQPAALLMHSVAVRDAATFALHKLWHVISDAHTHTHRLTAAPYTCASFTHRFKASRAAGGDFCYEWKSLLKIFLHSIFPFSDSAFAYVSLCVCYVCRHKAQAVATECGGGAGSWQCLHK